MFDVMAYFDGICRAVYPYMLSYLAVVTKTIVSVLFCIN